MSRLLSGAIEGQQPDPLQNLLQQALMPQQQQVAIPSMNPAQNQGMDRRKAMWDVLGAIGMGLATGNPGTSAQMFQQMSQQREERKQRDMANNASAQYLKANGAESLIPLVQSGEITMMEAIQMSRGNNGYRVLTPQEKKQYGLPNEGAFQIGQDGKISSIGGGGVTVNNMGNIPAGYELYEDPETRARRMRPIPGGPAYMEQQQAATAQQSKQGQSDVASDTVLNASKRALQASQNRTFGAYGQPFGEKIAATSEAEVRRQVEVLKSTARVETLNAMRAASGSSGLGSVTQEEGRMLEAKVGALDPSSPYFERDLMDYTRTLLQIVHGVEKGNAIFAREMGGGGAASGQQADPLGIR